MKCPKCGFENRPGARFCKQCGQSLPAQAAPPAPPTPSGTICPACGATAKPGARFCPRCGKPLVAEPTPPPPSPAGPPPPSAAQVSTQPSMPSLPQTYAQPPSPPPPPAAPSVPKRRSPRWLLWGGIIVAFLCIALIVTAIAFGPKIFGGEKEPAATPTVIESPTVETVPTEPPTAKATTAPPPTKEPPPPAFDAQVAIVSSTPELRVGELLTVTVTITNTGQVPFGNLRYRLRDWQPFLAPIPGPEMIHEMDVHPGESDTATFRLEATQVGVAQIFATVTVETREEQPSVKPVSSEYVVEVSVIQ